MGTYSQEVAFVTGAGSGIGRATAECLASRGAAVGLFDLSPAVVDVAQRIGRQGRRVKSYIGDVTNEEALAAAVADTADRFGGLDAAVACAGVYAAGTVVDTTVTELERLLAVNFVGAFLVAKYAMPWLVKKGHGSFVAVASDAGVTAFQGCVAYTASKHAVVGLVRSLAIDHGWQGVRSNAVCPALTETPMGARLLADLTPEERKCVADVIPLGRFCRPAEVAAVIAHLTSQEASFTNGQMYMIDGGETSGVYFRQH